MLVTSTNVNIFFSTLHRGLLICTNSFRHICLLQCWDCKHPTERKIPLLRGRTKPFRQFSVLKKWSHKEMLSKHLTSQNSKYKRARSVQKATYCLSSQRLRSQNTKKVNKTKKKCLTSIIAVSWKIFSTKTERSFKRSSLHFCRS